MVNNITHHASRRVARGAAFLLCLALALAFAPSALVANAASGRLGGTVTVTGGNASGITVELRQRSNGGEDKLLATATTSEQGMYEFTGQPSAPNDAFYYVKFTGGTGTLASWYSFPIIYVSGSDFTVPSVEMADVKLMLPQGTRLTLPNNLQWQPRRSGETYRIFVYELGKTDKAVLDSGSLGMRTQFDMAAGALPDGDYEAVVQVRDAVVGYGQSRAHFTFSIGPAAPAATVPAAPAPPVATVAPVQPQQPSQPSLGQSVPPAQTQPQQPAPAQPQQPAAPGQASTGSSDGGAAPAAPGAAGQAGSAPGGSADPSTSNPGAAPPASQPGDDGEVPVGAAAPAPDVQVKVTADRTEVQQGQPIVYRVEVTNQGQAEAPGVVVTDELPAGVSVDSAATRSTHGTVFIEGNRVTVQVGSLPPNTSAVVEIPANVAGQAGQSVSNQASVQYQGASAPVQSNSIVAQVAAPVAAPAESQPQAPAEAPAQAPAQTQPQAPAESPAQSQPQAPAQTQPQAPVQAPAQTQPQAPPAAPPASKPQAPAQKPAAAPPASASGSAQQAPAQKPAEKQNAPIPKTGGGFPVWFAVVILLLTLFARYLRGRTYRRV
jgi:uncharacterized repeat protein (TIGR01451 family)